MATDLPVQIKFFTKYNKVSIAGQIPKLNAKKFKIDPKQEISIYVDGVAQGPIIKAGAKKVVIPGTDEDGFAAVFVYAPASGDPAEGARPDHGLQGGVAGTLTITLTNTPGGDFEGDPHASKPLLYAIEKTDPDCNTDGDIEVPTEINLLS